MNLTNLFQFSQSSLQDYLDCPRRFELKYILQYKWPAPISEPVIEFEHHIQQGITFHQMIHQYLSGVPINQISALPDDVDLNHWWSNFIDQRPFQLDEGIFYPEYRLSIPFCGFRLVAQMDLVVVCPSGEAIIFDWKTSRFHPQKKNVLNRIQTRLYPLVLVEAGIRRQLFKPDQVCMKYWYAGFPDQVDEIKYASNQFEMDKKIIQSQIEEILHTSPGQFQLCRDTKKCVYCCYRSLCDRGVKAGALAGMENDDFPSMDESIDFDFNSVPEIRF